MACSGCAALEAACQPTAHTFAAVQVPQQAAPKGEAAPADAGKDAAANGTDAAAEDKAAGEEGEGKAAEEEAPAS